MDEVIAKFTEASALQCFAAFVSLVWLLGLVGLPGVNVGPPAPGKMMGPKAARRKHEM